MRVTVTLLAMNVNVMKLATISSYVLDFSIGHQYLLIKACVKLINCCKHEHFLDWKLLKT